MTWTRTARLSGVAVWDPAHPDLIPPLGLSARMATGVKILSANEDYTTVQFHRLKLKWEHTAVGSRHANVFYFLSPCCSEPLMAFALRCSECGEEIDLPRGTPAAFARYHVGDERVADAAHSANAVESWLHLLYPAYDVLALAVLLHWVSDEVEALIAARPVRQGPFRAQIIVDEAWALL